MLHDALQILCMTYCLKVRLEILQMDVEMCTTSNGGRILLDQCIITHLLMALNSPDDRWVNLRLNSTVGGLTRRIQTKYMNKTIIDISVRYSLIHSKYVKLNNLSFIQTLVPLSTFEQWLVMDVNVALILVRVGLLDDCVETADESPPKPQWLWL